MPANTARIKIYFYLLLFTLLFLAASNAVVGDESQVLADRPMQQEPREIGHFVAGQDLFLPQFDSKTDVDDLHSVAGVATMLNSPALSGVKYHAVAGAYGVQEGLYVPSPELFESAFGDNWSDAHNHRKQALKQVSQMVRETLLEGGNAWVAEAGQSDFTADWLKIIKGMGLGVDLKERIHVVQHSDWNESVTDADKLAYVKATATYHKIPDGNFPNNGSPDLHTESGAQWDRVTSHPEMGHTWQLARDIGNRYNGAEARYLNEAIQAGGMDFSDVSETCYIFGYAGLADHLAFFDTFLADPAQTAP